MSLIATLIPVSLVIASVIDKEFFDRWIIAGRVSVKTSYKSQDEIIYDIKKKKVNFRIQQNAIRVIYSKDKYMYFLKDNGNWILCYSKYDDINSIINFCDGLVGISVNDIKKKVETKNDKNLNKHINMPPLPENKVEVIPTRFADMSILENVLTDMGMCPKKVGDVIKVLKEKIEYSFYKENNQVYLRIIGNYDEKQVFEELQDLDVFYGRNVQKKSYDYITAKVNDMGLSIDEEKILEDNTIVLTINME